VSASFEFADSKFCLVKERPHVKVTKNGILNVKNAFNGTQFQIKNFFSISIYLAIRMSALH
jgi:hypothetical protein